MVLLATQFWYPDILFAAGNGWRAVGLIVAVDLVLGPSSRSPCLKAQLKMGSHCHGANSRFNLRHPHHLRYAAYAPAYTNQHFITLHSNSDLVAELKQRPEFNEQRVLFYDFEKHDELQQYIPLIKAYMEGFRPYSDRAQEIASKLNQSLQR